MRVIVAAIVALLLAIPASAVAQASLTNPPKPERLENLDEMVPASQLTPEQIAERERLYEEYLQLSESLAEKYSASQLVSDYHAGRLVGLSATRSALWASIVPLRKAALLGHPDAQHILASHILIDHELGDPNVAVALLTEATNTGHQAAKLALANILWDGGLTENQIPQNRPEAMELFLEMASDGHTAGQSSLGIKLFSSKSGPYHQPDEGIRWLTTAAEAGDPTGQHALGVIMLDENSGPFHDPDKGLEWLTDAAESGRVDAQYDLAKALHAQTDWRDARAAEQWYAKAAEAGRYDAMSDYGLMLSIGFALPRDLPKGVALLHRAAEAGHPPAATNMGELIYRGHTCAPPDYALAYAWVMYSRFRDYKEKALEHNNRLLKLMDAELTERERAVAGMKAMTGLPELPELGDCNE